MIVIVILMVLVIVTVILMVIEMTMVMLMVLMILMIMVENVILVVISVAAMKLRKLKEISIAAHSDDLIQTFLLFFFIPGQNVEEFFNRLAGITFNASVLKALEDLEAKSASRQIAIAQSSENRISTCRKKFHRYTCSFSCSCSFISPQEINR